MHNVRNTISPQANPRSPRFVTFVIAISLPTVASVVGAASADGTTKSPSEINASVYSAAMKAGSFHYVDHQEFGFGSTTGPQTETGDVALDKGVQFISGVLGDSETIVVGTAAYVKGNAAALEVGLLWPKSKATKYANRWISFTRKDQPYDSVIEFVVTRTFWNDANRASAESLPQRPASVGNESTLNGQQVDSVTSSIHDIVKSTNSSFIGISRIYFDPKSSLPVVVTDSTSGTEAGSPTSQQDVAAFTKWGEAVDVTAPTGAVAFSTLSKS
jgi:hypothetical protein